MADDIEQFIAEQKNRLARERQELQQKSQEKVYRDVQNGEESHHEGGHGQDRGGLSSLGRADTKSQLRKERQEEYSRFLEGKEAQSGQSRKVPEGDGMSLPIGDRTSAKNRAEHQRNMEYQAFLKQKEAQERQRREGRMRHRDLAVDGSPRLPGKDYGETYRDSPVRKEAASQTPNPPPEYDDARPPRPPRRGWGSPAPDYDEMLRRRREEEARYRRYDDLDYYPVRMSMRPSRSDPRLDRYPEEDGRYSRLRDSEDRRRVRFTDLEDPEREQTYVNDRPRHPPPHREKAQNGYGKDYYGVTRSNTLPEMERSSPVPKPSPRAKSATSAKDEGGFIIGKRETNSAIHRKKELYRKELAQQIQQQKEAKRREREEDLRLVSQNAPEATKSGRGSVPPAHAGQLSTQPPPVQALQPGTHPPPPQKYSPSFASQPYPTTSARVLEYPIQYSANGVAMPGRTVPFNPLSSSIQPPVPNLGLAEPLSRPPLPPPEPVGSLGLDQAYLRSGMSMLNQPFSLTSNTADPYHYYKLRDPMEPDPNYTHPSAAAYQPHPSAIPPSAQVPSNINSIPSSQPQYNEVVNTSGLRSESAIRNYVGDANLSPRAMKDPKSYQQQLLLQMKEKEKKKLQEREAQARYDARLEAEAEVYNPWGKGGGGAPMRNAQGQVFADLKQLHKLNEQVLQDPGKPMPLYADAITQDKPTVAAAPTGLARAMSERGMTLGPSDQPAGGLGVPENNPAQGNPTDVYKAQLMQQVEEKRRREAEEKEKIRQEEEREERRLAEQRERMQREFEQELEAKKKREEEKQRQQEELQAKIEEKRREAEERKREARRRVEQPATTATENQSSPMRQVTSPPVPAMAKNLENRQQVLSPPVPALTKNQENLERLKSPPIPTHQKKMTSRPLEEQTLTSRQSPRQTPSQSPRATPQQRSNRRSKDDEIPGTTRSVSPPVPAVSNRERDGGDERDVISALSAMRRQLQSEQRRVQSQLDKHQEYNKYARTKPPVVSRHASPQVDVFEVARHKGGGVSVRRDPINHQAAKEFKNLKGDRSQSQQKLLDQFPSEPHSDLALEAQQRALLKHQQSRLQEMKQDSRSGELYSANFETLGRASQSPAVVLESSSAFIGIENGETRELPKQLYNPDNKSSPGPSKPVDPFGSVTSFDSAMLERLAEKNKARSELLKALEPDSDSLADADDILNQFLAKQSIGSPMLRSASRKSEDLSLWLKPSEG